MSPKHSDYRPDPSRSIFLSGEISDETLSIIAPKIIELQHGGRGPVALYIDSLGGSVAHSDSIYSLIKSSDFDADPCRLITIVITKAMSAAADLLSAGDYALAYPQSIILHHGTRRFSNRALTQEEASLAADSLKRSNDRYASRLADRCMERLLFRYILLQTESKGRHQNPQISEQELVKRFVDTLKSKVSSTGVEVLEQAFRVYEQMQALSSFVINYTGNTIPGKNPRIAEVEANLLRGIIQYELETNKGNDWSFQFGGLLQLQEDFLLLTSYFLGGINKPLQIYCDRWGTFLLSPSERDELNAIEADGKATWLLERTNGFFRELWLFLTSLCRSLQEGENLLEAVDCYWLGLIDEVIGRNDLPSLRLIAEDEPVS